MMMEEKKASITMKISYQMHWLVLRVWFISREQIKQLVIKLERKLFVSIKKRN